MTDSYDGSVANGNHCASITNINSCISVSNTNSCGSIASTNSCGSITSTNSCAYVSCTNSYSEFSRLYKVWGAVDWVWFKKFEVDLAISKCDYPHAVTLLSQWKDKLVDSGDGEEGGSKVRVRTSY